MTPSFARPCLAISALLGIATVLASPATGQSDAATRTVVYSARTMGTYANVMVVTADSAAMAPAAQVAQRSLARVDSLMSNWTTVSEVARINRVAGREKTPVHPEVASVLDASLRLWRQSDGAFDITVEPLIRLWGFLGGPKRVPADSEIAAVMPRVGAGRVRFDRASATVRFDRDDMRIDLGGIAKGYGVEVAAESLRAHGVTDAMVDLSGNMHALGRAPGAEGWRVGIRDPRDRMRYFARLTLRDESISTSGQYQQFIAADGKTYGHIMDPRTGHPVQGLISVTVVAASALETDAWDTPLFVLGLKDAKRKAKAHPEFAAVLVVPGAKGLDTVWVEESLRDRFHLLDEARGLFEVRYF
jgi:thiamine biosynthesis lipoprotein